jgi:regulator of replication initiation timing
MSMKRSAEIPANRRNVERMAMQIENLQSVVNELLQENHSLKQRLVEEARAVAGTPRAARNRPMMKGEKVWY